ncbi:MAG TPA: hypothetical protein VGB98_03065 [Pyrinomonadaceae bacterium]|jgi:hypothetical protein
MTNLRCPGCGLVNFPTAVDCKRCGSDLSAAGYAVGNQSAYARAHTYDAAAPAAGLTPPRTLGILLTILGALLACGGVITLVSSRPSPYFLVVGVGIAFSGLLIASGKRAGLYVYFTTLGVMLVWSFAETGGVMAKLMPRVALPAIIGLHLAREKVRARLS